VEEYGTAGEVTDDSIIGRMRIACWIPKGTDTHSEYVIRIAFPRFSDYVYTYIALFNLKQTVVRKRYATSDVKPSIRS
jgi:hypothetical protein